MKDKMETRRSSWLISYPALGACLLSGVLAAFFGQQYLAGVLLFLFATGTAARLWAVVTARGVSLRVSSRLRGMFPDEMTTIDFEVYNGKFLPVIWMEVFCPLAQNLCMVPETRREPDEWERLDLEEGGFSTQLVGEKRLSFLMWYETNRFSIRWLARCRGVYSMKGWRLRTGDGFGLTQIECPIPAGDVRQFAVYPQLVPVSPDLFLRNLWTADTGTRGVMEDPTIIRSTRDYMTTDSMKQINWRLAARGLPLTVNVYEDILPKSVHFIFDGESFSLPAQRREAMEEALSILASETVQLSQHQVRCGLSLCAGVGGPARNYFGAESPYVLLQAMAGYELQKPKWDEESQNYVPQAPLFDEGPIYDVAQGVGRFYYIVHDTGCLKDRTLLHRLGHTNVSVLTYEEGSPYGSYETICLKKLREGDGHG